MITLLLVLLLSACVPAPLVLQNDQKPAESAWERCAREYPKICNTDPKPKKVKEWYI